jgi:hypothetical protein
MTLRRLLGWMLALATCAPIGGAIAGPEECLSLRANAAVATCANRFGPATGSNPASASHMSQQIAFRQAGGDEQAQLRSVPVFQARTPEPLESVREPERPRYEIDRSWLTTTVIGGVIGGCALVMFGIGVWRWRISLTKACPYCSTRLSLDAKACRGCFRAV